VLCCYVNFYSPQWRNNKAKKQLKIVKSTNVTVNESS